MSQTNQKPTVSLASLKTIDDECCAVMEHLLRMVTPCADVGMLKELSDVRDAVVSLHRAASAKVAAL